MALVDNKAKIQTLLAGINALPEAGSGEAPSPVLQEKAVTPTKEAQSVTPDSGYDGLSEVNVGAIPDEYIVPNGTMNITVNGTHNVREVENVNVNVPAPEITLQSKTVSPTTSAQTVKPDSGYDGLSQVTVKGDANLIGDNIVEGVSIFDVPGTNPYEKTATDAAVTAIATAITGKGVTVPAGTKLDGMAALIESIQAGGGGSSGTALSILDTGTVTYSEYTRLDSIQISHNSGVVPKVFWIYTNNTSTSVNGVQSALAISINGEMYGIYYYRASTTTMTGWQLVPTSAGKTIRWTDTVIDISSFNWTNAQMKTGSTYTWWCIG